MVDINFIDFKNAIIDAMNKDENRNDDNSVNWDYVESDLFIDGIMTEELRPAFNTIAAEMEATRVRII